MTNANKNTQLLKHSEVSLPSQWIKRFSPVVQIGGSVLDLACGSGRHSRYFLKQGNNVVAIDRSVEAIADLNNNPACEVICADIEKNKEIFIKNGKLAGRIFDAVVVTNYLHRPLFDFYIKALAPSGVFIYETFTHGNEKFCRPRNLKHLLESGELLKHVEGKLNIVAYEHGIEKRKLHSVVVQRICAIKPKNTIDQEKGEVEPQFLNP